MKTTGAFGIGMEEEMEDRIEERLEKVTALIVPDEAAKERILDGIKTRKKNRKRLSVRVPAAVLAACLFLCLVWCANDQSLLGEEVVVYAATEEYGWQKLKEGERILLKKEEFDPVALGGEFPYRCIFRLAVPENYLYDREMVVIGLDHVGVQSGKGDVLEWWIAEDRPEDAGRTMQGVIRLWIVDENRERIGALELELTKEDGKCYAELNRVWTKRGK